MRPSVSGLRIWVTAAMWMAWFTRRFPRRDSRQAFRFPEATSIGAVPLQAAIQHLIDNGTYTKIVTKWGLEKGAIQHAPLNPMNVEK